ncbi:hypothetical protein SETIT_2G370000v2 [Setaria italica]|uniref:Uncharacterized protein n=1 Tax=Setaria italica TaxID=4555 RepID=A0A368Q729_SETIT|nr:hypothetical protein SETIT_2G370000v2 [Setaria italica]
MERQVGLPRWRRRDARARALPACVVRSAGKETTTRGEGSRWAVATYARASLRGDGEGKGAEASERGGADEAARSGRDGFGWLPCRRGALSLLCGAHPAASWYVAEWKTWSMSSWTIRHGRKLWPGALVGFANATHGYLCSYCAVLTYFVLPTKPVP